MTCPHIASIGGIYDLLVYPTVCNPAFYAILLGALLIILTLTLFFSDRDRFVKSDAISSMAIASIALVFVCFIGTYITDSSGNVMITQNTFLGFFAVMIIFVGIWFFKD